MELHGALGRPPLHERRLLVLSSSAFHERVLFEAQRYGRNQWIFVRELLQNARDADATAVDITIEGRAEGSVKLTFGDDGAGMTLEHARRFLFTLYASSKRERRDAGRFGVGFWSVLLFRPQSIRVRSWPAHGSPWEIELDGALRRVTHGAPPPRRRRGTEVTLERTIDPDLLEKHVVAAAYAQARFLTQRRHPQKALALRVQGRRINAPFELAPPSLAFRTRSGRGVVSLARAPRVELHAHGLLVREAGLLDDLLSRESEHPSEKGRLPSAAEGTAPQAILDSPRLSLLLARSDARDEKNLRNLVNQARSTLRRLVSLQLDSARPRDLTRRLHDALHAMGAASQATVLLLATALALGMVTGALLWRRSSSSALSHAVSPPTPKSVEYHRLTPVNDVPHRELGGLYLGPSVNAPSSDAFPVALRYRPGDAEMYFSALVVPDPDRPPGRLKTSDVITEYRGADCRDDRLEVEIAAEAPTGPLRVPAPVEQLIDPKSVRLNGRHVALRASSQGEPVILVPDRSRPRLLITYSACAATAIHATVSQRPATRPALTNIARTLSGMPAEDRVEAAAQWVLAHVRYSTAPEIERDEIPPNSDNPSFVARILALGAGDCDAQNGVLVALLQDAGINSRLVVGYVGRHGRAFGLHAWAEYQVGGRPWSMLDLTLRNSTAAAYVAASRMPLNRSAAPRITANNATVPSSNRPSGLPWLTVSIAASLVLGLAIAERRSRRRRLRLDPSFSLIPLLRGALERPEAFNDVPDVFWRPLVPLLHQKAIPLGEAWNLATRGRLLACRRRTALVQHAARAGNIVIDSVKPEGALVASALGATPLDDWDERFAHGRVSPLLKAAEAVLSQSRETWLIRSEDASAAALRSADDDGPLIDALYLYERGDRASRRLLLSAHAPWLIACERRSATHPAQALFTLVDRILEDLQCPAWRRSELLASLARASMREAVGT